MNQLNLFDLMRKKKMAEWAAAWKEPEVGEYVTRWGSVISHCQRPAFIGEKVIIDASTESKDIGLCGILEDYIPYDGCYRSIVYTGKNRRSYITHRGGNEIFMTKPFDLLWRELNEAKSKG